MTGAESPTGFDAELNAHFTWLLSAYQTLFVSFAFGMVGERELARDIVQETFVAAWRVASRHGEPFHDSENVDGTRRWLFSVTYRQAALALRRQHHFVWQSSDTGDATHQALLTTPDFVNCVAEADALRAALQTLSADDAACFLLHAVQGFSTAEIAAIVRLRPDAVRKRLSRARQRLRAIYSVSALGEHRPLVRESEVEE